MVKETEVTSTSFRSFDRTSCGLQDVTEFNLSDDISDNTVSVSSTANFLLKPDEELKYVSDWMDQMLSVQKTELENYKSTSSGILKKKNDELSELNSELLQGKERLLKIKTELKASQVERKMLVDLQIKLKKEIQDMNEELQELIEEIPQLKIDAAEKVKELKDTYNCYNYTSKFYQQYLNIYVDIENMDPLLFKIYFFTSSANNKDFSITIKDSNKKWIFVDSTPKLPKEEFDLLQDKFFTDGDFRHLVYSIRKLFLHQKFHENDENTNINV